MDQAYMQSLVDLLVEDNSDHVKEFIKSNIALIDTYLENNQTMIDQMNNLYTDEEKEAMYTEVMVLQTYSTVMSLNIFINVVDGKEENDLENLEEDIRAIYEQYSDFDSMMILSDMMDENMNQLLDDIIESDYAIVDSMVDLITLQAQSSSLHDDYQFLVQDDDGGDGLNFMISETLEPGDYELRVSAYNVYYDMYLYDLEVMVDGNSLVSETVSLENVRNYIYNFTITETSEFMAYSQGNEVDTVGYLGWKEISNSEEELDEVEVITSFMSDLMTLMSPMVEEMTDEEYQAFIETVYSNVIIQLMAQNLVIDDPEVQTYIDAINIIKDSMDEVATNQLDLFQNLMNVLSKTEYMADIETYANLQGDAGTNASVILLANVFIDFYEESEDDLDAIIAEFLGAIDNADMMVLLDISPQMVSQLETMMTGYFDDLYTQAEIIKNYDYDSLTTLQEQNINTFILALSGMSE